MFAALMFTSFWSWLLSQWPAILAFVVGLFTPTMASKALTAVGSGVVSLAQKAQTAADAAAKKV